ncbi:DJ-1 family protein [Candidatus Peregrinibacteria bacterium]|nr:DJ-1 family protein [Candidatus Peregrinibacteria bacterium]
MAKVLLVIAPKDYQDQEYNDTKTELINKGHKVITVSTEKTASGKLGGSTEVDLLLKDTHSTDYDAVAFIGGPGVYDFFDYPPILDLAKEFYNAGKITAAICAAPAILARAGILKDKTASCFSGVEPELKNAGAAYTPDPTHQEGKIITASGPSAAKNFGLLIAKNL